MHRSRIVVIIGIIITGAAVLLPYTYLPSVGSINGIDGAAWPALLPLSVVFLIAIVGDRVEGNPLVPGIISTVFSCLAVVFTVVKLNDALLSVRGIEEASVGAGPWVLLSGTAVVLAGSLLGFTHRVG